jgi:YD repeat-containing protein
MVTETIKDRTGRTIGRIDDFGEGRTAWDASGRILGRYDRLENRTRDAIGRTVSITGDVLNALILGLSPR